MTVNIIKQTPLKGSIGQGKQRSYQEVVEFLDAQWSVKRHQKNLETIKALDALFDFPSKTTPAIFVAGSNGKSLTIHFAAKLLKEEGFCVGAYFSPHLLNYNERFVLNNETISVKTFTEIANEVINAAQTEGIEANSSELLTMIGLVYFKRSNVDVALLEVSANGEWNPVAICTPKIFAITRIATAEDQPTDQSEKIINEIAALTKKDTWVVCGDQSKSNLQTIANIVQTRQGNWAMPIRKLANLTYPFEQLHGRCAALAERISQLYVEKYTQGNTTVVANSLLAKPRGQRGRPTLEAKRQPVLNPKRTLEQFWKEEISSLPGRFQLLEKEKPTILLDNASNLDAFKNLLLGIRLLHYQRPFKGLCVVMGAYKDSFENQEFLKLIRYFFKKNSGSIVFFPASNCLPGPVDTVAWDIEKITNDVKNLKIKAKACTSFKDAFEYAKKAVEERNGLLVVTGSNEAIHEYWNYKGIKKF
jgi:folylpolyglutamate synthase/dihydrofolate synthase